MLVIFKMMINKNAKFMLSMKIKFFDFVMYMYVYIYIYIHILCYVYVCIYKYSSDSYFKMCKTVFISVNFTHRRYWPLDTTDN